VRAVFAWICVIVCTPTLPAYAATNGVMTALTRGSAESTQSAPAVSGANVVWTNFTSATTSGGNFDIFFLNLDAGGTPRNLTNTPSEQEFLEDIDGSNVVFTHNSNRTAGDIVVYDSSLDVAQTVAAANTLFHYEQPAIRGRYVVYVRVGAHLDIDGFDNVLGLPLDSLITSDGPAQARPRIAGNYVVYEDYQSGTADVFGYQISTAGPPFAIARSAAAESTPDIDGRTVVYAAHLGNADQIFAYDFETRVTTQLTDAESMKLFPRISGSRVGWADDRSGDLDLYSYNLAQGVEEPLVVGAGDQFLSDIDGNRVVYTSNASGFEEVYLFTLDGPPPVHPLPFGCDPELTSEVIAPFDLAVSDRRPVFTSKHFQADSRKSYFVCVENGEPDGSERTAHLLFGVDGRVVLTPADFKPDANPPQHVAAPLVFKPGACDHRDHDDPTDCDLSAGVGEHLWATALFGPSPAHVHISIRVKK
jgi:TolB protein